MRRAHADLEADVLEFGCSSRPPCGPRRRREPGQCDPDAAAACQQLCAAFLELRDAAAGVEEREQDIADADALWEDLEEGAPAEAAQVGGCCGGLAKEDASGGGAGTPWG